MWDVIIVGAGPGGSVLARELAHKGFKTLVIDRRQEIGAPVRCGEGLGEVWIEKARLKPDPVWARHKIEGASVYTPSGKRFRVVPKTKGYVIERKMFEKELAKQAIENGAKYMVKALVYDLIFDSGYVCGVKIRGPDGERVERARIVVGADGVDSKIGRMAGINTWIDPKEIDSGYEYEMVGVNIDERDIHIFLGNNVAPRGYVWIFPKGDTVANVGVGIIGDDQKSAKFYLDKFIKDHPEIFEKASPIEVKGGGVPVGKPLKEFVANGLVLIGDAARMVNPIHGGGMGTAMEAAMIASKWIERALNEGDVSKEFLMGFVKEWYEVRGNQLLQVYKVRRFAEQLKDSDYETLYNIFSEIGGQKLLEFTDGNKLGLFAKIFAKSPRLALLAAKTFI